MNLANQFLLIRRNNDDSESPVLTLRCLSCQTEFVADTDILRPKHVEHDLGRSITFICPSCDVKPVVTYKELKLSMLKDAIDEAMALCETYETDMNLKFMAVKADISTLIATMQCLDCGHEFECDHHAGKGTTYVRDPSGSYVTITCPRCGVSDKFTRENTEARLRYVANVVRVSNLTDLYEKAEAEPD